MWIGSYPYHPGFSLTNAAPRLAAIAWSPASTSAPMRSVSSRVSRHRGKNTDRNSRNLPGGSPATAAWGRPVMTTSGVVRCRRATHSSTHSRICAGGWPYMMSLPTSVTSARVGAGGCRSSSRQRPDWRMPGSPRTRKVLAPPYDRPWPSAASTSTSGPHTLLAVATIVWNPRVRLLAPTATILSIRPSATLRTPPTRMLARSRPHARPGPTAPGRRASHASPGATRARARVLHSRRVLQSIARRGKMTD